MAAPDDAPENTALNVPLPTPEATAALGRALAHIVARGDVIALHGDLGAGKTALARALIQALGVEDEVPSPTFTLVQTYPVDGHEFDTVWHFDLYRIDNPEEVWELDIEDAFETGVTLIEWPARMGENLPKDCLQITLSVRDEERSAVLAGGPRWLDRLKALRTETG